MADGNRGEALSKLEVLRDHGISTIRQRLNDISDIFQAGLTNQVHYWPMHNHMGELVHESQSVRQTFLNWMANHPDLVEAQNPEEVVYLNDPMMGHAGIIARGNRVLNLMADELNLIIGVLPDLGHADVEEIYGLVSDAVDVLVGLVEGGGKLMVRVLEDQDSDKTSTSTSTSTSSTSDGSGSSSP
ncbi:hypothetical protein Bca4012_016724 [Brassica carinata]|uniref:Uncharacterized protein n=1 Tax=Brassica carinata TaxID=52824 RepID=A0A8X7WNV7_BRACI|nr:hypothetical protein Bca52824_004871 [Brassica carinata]